jgi:predicted dehydrogenase
MRRSGRKKIRVGVVGLRRGLSFAQGAGPGLGMELVALCDTWAERLESAGRRLKVETYTDFDRFLEHDMDAVILANFFHQHAPFAVKALRAGFHVMSETSACATLGEGVELIEAVEKSGKTYMFAENYPYMVFNQEMRRLYQLGRIGEFQYGEGEYVHPMSAKEINALSPGERHWRNWIPATYYCTHALAPVMYITGTWPVKVNGFVIPCSDDDPQRSQTARRNDTASMIALRMDNDAVVKLLQVSLRGEGIWVRLHGTQGLMENQRGGDQTMLRVRRERFDKKRGEPVEQLYRPDFPECHEKAMKAGHGGGDFFTPYHFSEAIRAGEQPFLDVYRGVAMSIVGILAYRSALNDSNTVEVPDFRKKETRTMYRNDHWTPDPARRKAGDPWPSITGNVRPSAQALAEARKVWREIGYQVE